MSTPPSPPTTASEKKPTFEIGQTLGHANQFKIVQRIGHGGCGEVYLALEERANRRVAIKTLLLEHNADKKMLRRFKAEYTLGSLLSHPSLVQMYDLYENPPGIHYIVMEYIEGESLSARLYRMEQAEGQLGIDEALRIGWQVASLFAQLHERRIIHRDLKGGNILAVQDPTIHGGERYKLIDFGIAKLVDKSQAQSLQIDNETTQGALLGTVAVMSPETLTNPTEQGPESDVYSLGCLLYRAIAGNYPFGSASDLDTFLGHLKQAPIPLTVEDPLIPRDVADMIHRMIDKDPAKRPTMRESSEFFARKLGLAASAAGQVIVKGQTQELQAALGDASLGPATATASGSVVRNVAAAPSEQRGQLVAGPTEASRRRRRAMIGIAVSVAVILATGAVAQRSLIKTSTPQLDTFEVTVRIHGSAGQPSPISELVGSKVMIDLGNNRRTAAFNTIGEATLKEVPSKFYGHFVPLTIQAPGYVVFNGQTHFMLSNDPIYVSVAQESVPMPARLRAAVGFVHDGRNILMVRRRHKEGKLSWQFPSGIVKPLQDPKQRVIEEILRETGVSVKVVNQVGERISPDTKVHLIYFDCIYLSGDLHNGEPDENTEVAWVPADKVDKYITSSMYEGIVALLDEIKHGYVN